MKNTIKIHRKTWSGTIKSIVLLFLATFLLQSCNKDEYQVINNEVIPTAQALKTLYANKEASLIKVLSFDASTTLNYTSPKGVHLTIAGSCLRKNGNPVVGEVKVKYIEIFDKGNMLAANKPTLVNAGGGTKELLYSGGEFYIQASQENVNLTLTCPFSLDIPTSITGGTQPGMLPFVGTVDTDAELSWDQAFSYDMAITTGTSPIYAALIPSFGWFNADYYTNYTGPKTTITENVPAGYGSNSSIFLAVKAFPNSLGKSWGQFPVGLDCYLIFVTEKNGKFRYAIKPQILTANHQVTFSLSETTTGTADELTAAINALP